jgi:hypothetical protein
LTSSKSGAKPFNRKLKTILKEAQTKRKEEAYDGIEYVGFDKRGKVMYPDKKNWDENKDKPEEKVTANFDKEKDGPETKTWMSMSVVEPASLVSKFENPNPCILLGNVPAKKGFNEMDDWNCVRLGKTKPSKQRID